MPPKIEDIITRKLEGNSQKNALELTAHIRATADSNCFPITMHDENEESGWNIANLGFIIITGSNDFPGPWSMWLGADNLGKHLELPIDEHIKEFAWSHVSPCGSCGGNCSPGVSTKVFGKEFENTCQANLLFINPDATAVECMKKIIDIRKSDIKNK